MRRFASGTVMLTDHEGKVMSIERIDEIALRGSQWAENDGVGIPSGIESEMDLMAFNAGVSNANIRLGLNVEKYNPVQSSVERYHDKPASRSDLSM